MTAVAKAFETMKSGSSLGRTALQKLVYFSKVAGVPVPCSFSIYNYGPFADKVAASVDSL